MKVARVDCGLFVSIFAFPLVLLASGGFSTDSVALALIASVFTALATLLVAAPLLVWCRRKQILCIWPFIAGGAGAGMVFSLPITVFVWPLSVFFTSTGAMLGAVFWLIAVYRNPALFAWHAFSNSNQEERK